MLKIYGTMLCKDCVACREAFDQNGVAYEYLDFSADIANLKAFLVIRDREPIFDSVKADGRIGVPCIVTPAGEVTLDWERFV